MNFRPTIIKTLLAITIGFIGALYFRDNCIGCNPDLLRRELIIGFIPAFLWIYGIISIIQVYESRSKFWHYLVAVPFVIIIPLIVGVFLQGFFDL